MGYLHIDNLYKNQDILMFKECYALEKIHGTSAHVSFNDGKIKFFSGGESHERFVSLFDKDDLLKKASEMGLTDFIVYGEAYGGKQQGMRETYGDELKFVAFDVKVGDSWLSVPDAEQVVVALGLEYVSYNLVSTSLEVLDKERDKPSVQAVRNGMGSRPREGIVLRPLVEVVKNNGKRIISKHKGEAFQETATKRKIIDPDKIEAIREANAIADEWVTHMRLQHVLQKFPEDVNMESTRDIINSMIEDVEREGKGEIVMSKAAHVAIGKRTAVMFRGFIQERLRENS